MLIPQLRKTLCAHNFLAITDVKTAQQLFFHLPAMDIQIKNLNLALCVPRNHLYKGLVTALKKMHFFLCHCVV